MKIVYFLLLLSSTCLAESTYTAQAGVGYRQDSLNWNIGSPTGHPDILSELSWKNLRMIDYHAQLTYDNPSLFYARFSGDYAVICDGTVRDSDWDEDGRTEEFSRSINNAGKGEAFDLSLGIGFPRYRFLEKITLIPLIGFAMQEQHLQIYDGFQVINTENEFTGPFSGLHSNYRAKWYSPWIGFDMYANLAPRLWLYSAIEGHFSCYRGTGHWNLREDFTDDFKHEAWGGGIVAKLAANYQIRQHLDAGILLEYQNHWCYNGSDYTTALEDGVTYTVKQPLNSVRWQSARAILTMTYLW